MTMTRTNHGATVPMPAADPTWHPLRDAFEHYARVEVPAMVAQWRALLERAGIDPDKPLPPRKRRRRKSGRA